MWHGPEFWAVQSKSSTNPTNHRNANLWKLFWNESDIHHIFQDHFETALKSFNLWLQNAPNIHPNGSGKNVFQMGLILPSNDSA